MRTIAFRGQRVIAHPGALKSFAPKWTPDPQRHVAKLVNEISIDGVKCLKQYATDYSVVFLQYGLAGKFLLLRIERDGVQEVLGDRLAECGDLDSAIRIAAQEPE
jgi:hypothetical protein